MTDERGNFEQRVLVLPLTAKDGELTRSILDRAAVECQTCTSLQQICDQLEQGAGAVLMAEEAVVPSRNNCLTDCLARQPPWSDLPVLILARPGADSSSVAQAMDLLGNVTVLERPVRIAALVSAVRTALRARRRQYEARRLLELHRTTMANLGEGMYTVDRQGLVTYVNPEAERLFGWTAEELLGKRMHDVTHYQHPDGTPFPIEECSGFRVLHDGQVLRDFEDVFIRKDGTFFPVAYSSSPLRDADDQIIGLVVVFQDITERKRHEQALRDADRRKDEFLAMLAHELRNPLAPIRNSLNILRLAKQTDPTVEQVSQMMQRQVDHMVRLVDDLLEVSRITRGRIELRRELVELAGIVRTAVETSQPLITAAGHQLAVSLPPEPITVNADPVRLSQVFANLLNNSAKYTEAGGRIWLTVRREAKGVVISVRDSGIGIAPREAA